MTRTARLTLLTSAGCVVGALACAALLPVGGGSREAMFEIPKGTWARRRAGNPVEILPSKIELVLGIRDILVLRNLDNVPQMFGPTLIMPGQSFRLPFDVASDYQFACTAHVSGEMTVSVAEAPKSAWERLGFRASELVRAVVRMSRGMSS